MGAFCLKNYNDLAMLGLDFCLLRCKGYFTFVTTLEQVVPQQKVIYHNFIEMEGSALFEEGGIHHAWDETSGTLSVSPPMPQWSNLKWHPGFQTKLE